MSPLLGLLGTIIGMIEIFGVRARPGWPIQPNSRTAFQLRCTTPRSASSSPSPAWCSTATSARGWIRWCGMEIQAVKLVEIIQGERKA